MPYGNKTGPQGQGPLTGRGLGSCNDVEISEVSEIDYSEYPKRPIQRGFGLGRGPGRGFGLGRGIGRGLGLGPGRGRWF